MTKPRHRYPRTLRPLFVLLLAFIALPASADSAQDASKSADPSSASALEEATADQNAAPSDKKHDEEVDNKEVTADSALQQAIEPRRAQVRALATVFGSDTQWSVHDGWLKAVAEHATKGRAAWTNRLCEDAKDGAEQYQKALGANRLDRPSAQIEAEVLLDAAAQCEQPLFIELAMRSVSHALPHMREGLTTPGLRDALVRLAAADHIERFQKTDTRLLLPYIDALLHLRDYAAVERLSELKIRSNPSVGKEQLEQANARAKRAKRFTIPVNAPKDCHPVIDGERVRSRTVEIREGTHNVGCTGQSPRLRYYDNESTAVFD